jgi:hypothetical protein
LSGEVSEMNGSAKNDEPELVSSKKLKLTLITPHMEEKISPGKNLIYCSTFQLAWNQLQDEVIKEEIRLEGAPRMAQLLGKRLSTKDDLSDDCYLAMAGEFTPELVERLNRALKDKFGKEAPPKLRASIPQSLKPILAYAYLCKNLEFPEKFQVLPRPMLFESDGKKSYVKAFGYSWIEIDEKYRELREQVSVISGRTSLFDSVKRTHKSDDSPEEALLRQIFPERYSTDSANSRKPEDIILQLKCKSEDDEMILALMEPKDSLLATVESVMERAQNPSDSRTRVPDCLEIPKLDLNVEHSFEELLNTYFENEGWEEWFISSALQWIRFGLNEGGAALRSWAKVEGLRGIPLRYKFNRPFLIYLKRKGARYPYLVVWVGNDELLLKK